MQKKIDSIPEETSRRRVRVEALERRRDELQKLIRDAEARYQEREEKVRSLEMAVKLQEAHRDHASSSASFTAAQHQIEYLQQDKEKLQNEEFDLVETIESQTPELQRVEAELVQVAADFAEFEADARKLQGELEAERAAIAEERRAYLDDIPPQNLALYESMFQQHHGQAVVPADGSYCNGCYTKLTPNDLACLRTGSTLVSCKSCGRILYLPE